MRMFQSIILFIILASLPLTCKLVCHLLIIVIIFLFDSLPIPSWCHVYLLICCLWTVMDYWQYVTSVRTELIVTTMEIVSMIIAFVNQDFLVCTVKQVITILLCIIHQYHTVIEFSNYNCSNYYSNTLSQYQFRVV